MHQPAQVSYVNHLNQTLRPTSERGPLVVDLFAGCGGLALGFEAQGFETLGYEMNADCCATYNNNLSGICNQLTLDKNTEIPPATIVIGGPPCQPFSVGGKQLGLEDSRDGFPVFISVVERLQPDLWLFENVRGLFYRNRWYLEEILQKLQSLGYFIEIGLFNAVNFGVPQNRERVVVVGHHGSYTFPSPEHYKVNVGEALEEMILQVPPESKFLTPSMDNYIARYEKASKCVRPRDLYVDQPARTLTCRNLAGATGDMLRIRLADGRRRRLLLREAARLQSFPDWFEFRGGETSCYNQVGNSVAPMLAYHLAGSVRQYLKSSHQLQLVLTTEIPILWSTSKMIKLPKYVFTNQLDLVTTGRKGPLSKEFARKDHEYQDLINEALYILENFGVKLDQFSQRHLERIGMLFLALADIQHKESWEKARDVTQGYALGTREIISYYNTYFGENINLSSYDDIKRKDLVQLEHLEIAVINLMGAATNSAKRKYGLNSEYAQLVRSFGSIDWQEKVRKFMATQETYLKMKVTERSHHRIRVTLPDSIELDLSPGSHNELHKAVVEEFIPRFGYEADILYFGDTAKKMLVYKTRELEALGFVTLAHEELPDIIAYSAKKNWLYLIEAVNSYGPINDTRKREFDKLTANCSAEIIYITAFADRAKFRKYVSEIAWETEVWIASDKDHLIHFNGEKFLGPYERAGAND